MSISRIILLICIAASSVISCVSAHIIFNLKIDDWANISQIALVVLTGAASMFAYKTVKETQNQTVLEHPPRFKMTRSYFSLIKNNYKSENPNPGDEINGLFYFINCGRHTAEVHYMSSYFYFSKTKSVPMNLCYSMEKSDKTARKNGVVIKINNNNRFIKPGEFIKITKIAKNRTPDDLIYGFGPNGEIKCNYGLYIIASIKYRDQTGRERGNYFCKRYDFEKQNFFDAPEYENED